jgi:CheY-like chemotaxis protein
MRTTETDSAMKQRAEANGAAGWLNKPFDPNQILATI